MKQIIRVKVSGEYACWTRPEQKVERFSAECMTPSAARNILDAICWRPQMRWVVTSIAVLKPIRFHSFRRNELQSKLAPSSVSGWMKDPSTYQPQPAGAGTEDATPRNTLALRNVSYIIEAYPHVYNETAEDTPVKYMAMLNRRVEKGQCFQRPYMGCREFAAYFEAPAATDKPIPVSMDLGYLLYDIHFREDGKSNQPVFFQAKLVDGVLQTDPDIVLPDAKTREEVIKCSYKH